MLALAALVDEDDLRQDFADRVRHPHSVLGCLRPDWIDVAQEMARRSALSQLEKLK